ncbi:MAG: MFS transporter [Alphaproteobacteria bacterium]
MPTISMITIGLQLGMAWPLMSLFLAGRGMGEEQIGLVAACSAIAPLMLWPFFTSFFRRFGAIGTIMIGGALAVAGLFWAYHAGTGWGAYGARFVIGAGQTLHWVAAEAWVNHIPRERERGRAISAYSLSWGIGLLMGPQILAWSGTEGIRPFMIAAIATSLPLLPVLFTPRGLVPNLMPEASGLADAGLARIRRLFMLAPLVFITAIVAGASEGHMFRLLVLYRVAHDFVTHAINLNPPRFGQGGALAILLAGWAADRMGRRHLLTVPAVLALLSCLAIPLLLETPALLCPMIVLMGGSVTALYAVGLISLGSAFKRADLTPANGIFVVAYTVGSTIGPILGGVAIEHVPPHGLMLSVASLMVVMLLARAGLAVFRA